MVDGCRVGCPVPSPSGVGFKDGMVDGGAVRRIVRVPVETGVGPKDGAKLGLALGCCDGDELGSLEGSLLGTSLGALLGAWLGCTVGPRLGPVDGIFDGDELGSLEGSDEGDVLGAPATNDDSPRSTQESLVLSYSSAMTRIILFQPSFIEGLHVPEAVRTDVKPSASMLYDGLV